MRIEVASTDVDAAFESMTKNFQREASISGFRPGKAPRDMVLKRFDKEIQDEVKKKLIPDAYDKALKEHKIEVVSYPDIEEIQFGRGQALQFAATVETAPQFELPEYKGLAAKRETTAVTDADVERAINMLRDRQSTFNTVAREAKETDIAVVNYTGTCDGKPITDTAPTARGLTEQKNFWVNLDKKAFIPGFAEQLFGTKAGDKRTVNVDFPADFVTPQLANKKGVYEVEIVEIKERVLPEVNDAFAKSYEAESLDKLKEGVRKDLENELTHKKTSSIRNQVVEQLLSKVQFELPEIVVAEQTRNVVYDIVQENQKRGIPTELIENQKEQIYAAASETAKTRVKADFILRKIAAKENIVSTQQEVIRRITYLAGTYNIAPEQFVKDLQKNNGIPTIYQQVTVEKTIDFLVTNAVIEDVAPEAPKAA
jgi:trigger factor